MSPPTSVKQDRPERVLEDIPFAKSHVRLSFGYPRPDDRQEAFNFPLGRSLAETANDNLLFPERVVTDGWDQLVAIDEFPDRIQRELEGLGADPTEIGFESFLLIHYDFEENVPVGDSATDTLRELTERFRDPDEIGERVFTLYSSTTPESAVSGRQFDILTAPTLKVEFLTNTQADHNPVEIEERLREQVGMTVDVFGVGPDTTPANGFVVDFRRRGLFRRDIEAAATVVDNVAQEDADPDDIVKGDQGEVTSWSVTIQRPR